MVREDRTALPAVTPVAIDDRVDLIPDRTHAFVVVGTSYRRLHEIIVWVVQICPKPFRHHGDFEASLAQSDSGANRVGIKVACEADGSHDSCVVHVVYSA